MTTENSLRSLYDVRNPADLLREMRLVMSTRVDWRKFGWRRLWLDGAERWRIIRWAEAFDIVKAAGLVASSAATSSRTSAPTMSPADLCALRVGRAVIEHKRAADHFGVRVLP
jgi:hypothetical protein